MRCSLESGWVLARRRDTKQAVPSSFLGKGRVLSPCATSLRMSTPSAVQARASKALALAQAAGGGPSPDGRWPEIVSGGVCCVHTRARARRETRDSLSNSPSVIPTAVNTAKYKARSAAAAIPSTRTFGAWGSALIYFRRRGAAERSTAPHVRHSQPLHNHTPQTTTLDKHGTFQFRAPGEQLETTGGDAKQAQRRLHDQDSVAARLEIMRSR